jgi:hypothetical protein
MYLLFVPFSLGPWLFAGHPILTRSPLPTPPRLVTVTKKLIFFSFPSPRLKNKYFRGSKLSLPRSFLSRRIGQKDKKYFLLLRPTGGDWARGWGVGEGGGWLPFLITKQGDTHPQPSFLFHNNQKRGRMKESK